jgi:hypothetical protein
LTNSRHFFFVALPVTLTVGFIITLGAISFRTLEQKKSAADRTSTSTTSTSSTDKTTSNGSDGTSNNTTDNVSASFAYGPIIDITGQQITFRPYNLQKQIPLQITAQTKISKFDLQAPQNSPPNTIDLKDIDPQANILAYYQINYTQQKIFAQSIEVLPPTALAGPITITPDGSYQITGRDGTYNLLITDQTKINQITANTTTPTNLASAKDNEQATAYSSQKPDGHTIAVERLDLYP